MGMARRVALGWLGAAAAAVGAPTVRADVPRDASLIWHAPRDCPDAVEVRARIERRLGSPIEHVVSSVAVDVAIDRSGAGPRFVARIDLRGLRDRGAAAASQPGGRDGGEVRTLTSARCDDLADAVAVVIAGIAAEIEPPVAATPAIRERVAARVPEPRRPWGAGVRVLGVSGVGALPGVSLGGELGGYLRERWVVFELAAMRWRRSSEPLHDGAPDRVDMHLGLTAIRVGWGPEHLPLRAWLAAELGTLRGEGIGLTDPRTGSGRWFAVGAGFAVAWPMFDHARLVGTIEVAAPVETARFVLQSGTEIYRSAPVAVRSGWGLEIGWR
jgi:hypothetical protein